MLKIIAWLLWPTKLQDGEFDINGMIVYGIERDSSTTMISYISCGKLELCTLHCPLSTHNRMLQQFRAKLAAKENKP